MWKYQIWNHTFFLEHYKKTRLLSSMPRNVFYGIIDNPIVTFKKRMTIYLLVFSNKLAQSHYFLLENHRNQWSAQLTRWSAHLTLIERFYLRARSFFFCWVFTVFLVAPGGSPPSGDGSWHPLISQGCSTLKLTFWIKSWRWDIMLKLLRFQGFRITRNSLREILPWAKSLNLHITWDSSIWVVSTDRLW